MQANLTVSATAAAAATSSLAWSGFVTAHGFDASVAAVSLAARLPPVPVRVRRMIAPVRVFRLLSTSPAQREIIATFARCGEVIAVLLGGGGAGLNEIGCSFNPLA